MPQNRPILLYKILFFPARLALRFYCRKIYINRPDKLKLSGPLLLAANHPNSFLDAIIIASLFKKPVYSLARGDAFVGGVVNRLLKALNMLPVYRLSEGSENINKNYNTFAACEQFFKEGKIVLIFSEGLSRNEWRLRPLKKGTARLALSARRKGIPLTVLPLGINYSSFRIFGKVVTLQFGEAISLHSLSPQRTEGEAIREFNRLLRQQLTELVVQCDRNDISFLRRTFNTEPGPLKKALLSVPACPGFLLHAPLFYAAHFGVRKRAKDHYDSIMVGILFLAYPLYLLAVAALFTVLFSWPWGIGCMLIMPLTALALLHVKNVFGFGAVPAS